MKFLTYPFYSIGLALLLIACKVKVNKDPEPNNNAGTKTPSCYLSSSNQMTNSILTSNIYNYNNDGTLLTQTSTTGSTTVTTAYTYNNKILTRADESTGYYTISSYTSGKLSGARGYIGTTLQQRDTVIYSGGTIIYRSYDENDNLLLTEEFTLSTNDDILSDVTVTYDATSGDTTDFIKITYSSFDGMFSAAYANRKHDLGIFPVSKHNAKTLQYIYKTYNSGVLTSTSTGLKNLTYHYNDYDVATKDQGTLYINSTPADTQTSNYAFNECGSE